MDGLSVVKIGGSLFDLPDTGPRLLRWLARFSSRQVLLVPGGGPTADIVRNFDRRHRLGEEKSHWLALRALSLNAHFLAELLPGSRVVPALQVTSGEIAILDPLAFCLADERDHRAAALPHSWAVTSDSVAARVAIAAGAKELILLKSVTLPATVDWDEAARQGWVDEIFPGLIRRSAALQVRAINFRAECD